MSLVLAGITLTISNTSSASDSFTSLSACRNHFNTSVQAGNQSTEASDPWCKTKMTALDFCTEQALMTSLSTTSVNAAQVPALRNSLQTTCQQQLAAQATSGAGAGTGTASTGGTAFDASGRPNPPTAPAQQNCSSVATAEQAACNVRLAQYQRDLQTYQSNLQAYNQRQAAAQQQQQQQAAQQQQQQMQMNMQGMQMMLGVAAPLLDGSGDRRDNGGSGNSRGNGNNGSGGSSGASNGSNSTPFGGNTAQNVDRMIADAERQLASIDAPIAKTPAQTRSLGGQAGPAGKETAAALPGAPVEPVVNAPTTADGAGIAEAELNTELTSAAQSREQKIRQLQNNLVERLNHLGNGAQSIPFMGVINAYNEIGQELNLYVQDKQLCVKKAELANKLCIEGRSPGARAAKALVDFSGPVLAMMASAQKACSGTRKVMNLAAIGMTVAKGVCVAAKMTCDAKCADTTAKLNAIATKVQAVDGFLATDVAKGIKECATRGTQSVACKNDLVTKKRTVNVVNSMLNSDIQQENNPQNGTAAQMVANCQEKGKDILLMATNIMGMMMAKSGAKKCEEQLAASAGTAGASGDISTADYCASAATSGTQFCKCQSNPTAEGCAGSLAAGGAVGDANNQRGANLKANQGVNGFAGGGTRGSGSNFNLGGGSNGTESGAALASLEAGGSVTGAAGTGSGGSVAGSAGSAAAADGTGNGVKPGEKADDKKWNFGSFVPGGGGAMGGRGGQAGGNGNLTSQQQEAIERKIASERYSAEITTSSGKSNFDKIKSVVRQISSTLDPNQ